MDLFLSALLTHFGFHLLFRVIETLIKNWLNS